MVALGTSIAVGSGGLGLVGCIDVTNEQHKVAHCRNAACMSTTVSAPDGVAWGSKYTSPVVGGVGLGFIVYYEADDEMPGAAHCDDVACTSASTWLPCTPA